MDLGIYNNYFIYATILIIIFSLIIDFIIGDPHFKLHLVNLIGKTLDWLKFKLLTDKSKQDKIMGILLLFIVVLIFCTPIFFFQIFFWWIWNIWDPIGWQTPNIFSLIVFTIVMGFLLKWSFAVKNLGDTTIPIGESLKNGNLEKARSQLSFIVRRDTKSLEHPHIISATVECIAESSTDSITSVFWFYLMGSLLGVILFALLPSQIIFLFLGVPFAYIFRIINTADSVVGSKDPENINIGWFSARMDDFSNYIPTRLTVLFMLLAGKIMKKDVKNAWTVLKVYKNKTESVNAGWTMSTMAGLLNVELEKIGYYKLGVPNRDLEPDDIKVAYKIIRLTSIFFILALSTIFLIIISMILLLI